MQEPDDFHQGASARISRYSKQYEIVDVAAVALDLEFSLNEMIERIENDQRVKLAEQVSYWNADRLAMVGKQHHEIDEPAILDFLLDLDTQDGSVYPVKEFPDVELQCIAAVR